MALLTSQKEPQKASQQQQAKKKRIIKHPQEKQQKQKPPSSWDQIKNLLSCKQIEVGSNVHDPSSNKSSNNYSSKLGSSCSSICSFKDVVHGNTRVVHHSPESSALGLEARLLTRKGGAGSSSGRSANAGGGGGMYNYYSARGMQFSKLSGCYECRMIVDPSRYPLGRSTICSCNQCGEAFPKIESLELHQKVRHAVSELGPEDSGRNIVEIIFKSSWLKKDDPIFKIERILKVHNTQRTIQRFEDCRDAVKARALYSHKKNPRCAADGNELLRFHCTTLTCSLGSRGLTGLCGSIPGCGVCTTLRHGFQYSKDSSQGVSTTASSGRAHDLLAGCNDGHGRAMLVCRVIAGRVKHVSDNQQMELESAGVGGSYDSVAGQAGIFSTLEELFVFNTNAILPCFVVIYKTLGS